MSVTIEVSAGELLDKLAILEIKSERITDAGKLFNVRRELDVLREAWAASAYAGADIGSECAELKAVNEALWDIEDRIREKERAKSFDAEFIELARSVYLTNDRRAAVKRLLNDKLGSALVEEKSYVHYR